MSYSIYWLQGDVNKRSYHNTRAVHTCTHMYAQAHRCMYSTHTHTHPKRRNCQRMLLMK